MRCQIYDTHRPIRRPNNKTPTAKSLWFFSFNRTTQTYRLVCLAVCLFNALICSFHFASYWSFGWHLYTIRRFRPFLECAIPFEIPVCFSKWIRMKKWHFLPNQMLSFASKAMRLSMHDLDKQSHIDGIIMRSIQKYPNEMLTFLQMRRFSFIFRRREWRKIKTKHFPNSCVQYKLSLIIQRFAVQQKNHIQKHAVCSRATNAITVYINTAKVYG